ncbi:protein-L-isoaspartate(D-aspartate) O-methyltransferase [Murinocardiopsis flavida]|uniref:Protein-L-isoaspartate O-methyltransferase n=1 Tax=Murinocardiopsis flavida TaxID=645275 RepID=A0A2P8CY40_9ACTN|nr:methyltransferase, FxLD system [Murinocardiopsis flavida]PSK89904.1 protein-L-isoaspartate(D-aspartate) O-methyltransferase [Murinocardiopsis flavida]
MIDTDHTPESLRAALVDQLRADHYVRSARVERALREVPRHLFVPDASTADAYANESVTTHRDGTGTIRSCASAPSVVAMMLEQLDVQPGHRVLEIGAGTGYNAALLRELTGPGGQVTTIDIDTDVVEGARTGLAAAGYDDVTVLARDGALGDDAHAPYDRIIVTVGAWDVPSAWRDQLSAAGRMVVPLRFRGTTRTIAFAGSPDRLESRSMQLCGFIPMRGHADGEHALALDGDDVTLYYDEDQEIAPASGILDQPRTEAWSGVTVAGSESFDGVWLRLATAEPGTCRITATPSAVERGRATPAIPSLSPALAEGASLSYFTYRRLTGDGPARAELGAIGHGPAGDDLAERICNQIRVWDQDRSAVPTVEAVPSGTSDEQLPRGFVVDKRHSRLVLNWPTT